PPRGGRVRGRTGGSGGCGVGGAGGTRNRPGRRTGMTGQDTAAEPAAPPAQRNSLLRDSLLIFRRSMRISLRNPAWVAIGLSQPILYVVLFGPLLKPIAGQLGTGNAYQLFVPGILVQLAIFGSLFVGFGLIAEYRAGVIEAQRVTPASRLSLLL